MGGLVHKDVPYETAPSTQTSQTGYRDQEGRGRRLLDMTSAFTLHWPIMSGEVNKANETFFSSVPGARVSAGEVGPETPLLEIL